VVPMGSFPARWAGFLLVRAGAEWPGRASSRDDLLSSRAQTTATLRVRRRPPQTRRGDAMLFDLMLYVLVCSLRSR
jgi:hypothetical protein